MINDSNSKFVSNLGNAISRFQKETSTELGCGLGYLASVINDRYSDEAQRHNKLPVRLIGDQAIALANFSYGLIDGLKISNESPAQKLKRLALSKSAEFLRNAVLYLTKLKLALLILVSLRNFVPYILTCMYYFLKWMWMLQYGR